MAITTLPGAQSTLSGPALLYLSPTALDAENNYGSLLGLIDGPIQIQPLITTRQTTAEPYGDEELVERKLGARAHISFRVHAYQSAAWTAAFMDAASGAGMQLPGATRTGTNLLTSYAKKYLIMPLDDGAANPVLLVNYGLGRITGPAEYGSDRDLIFPVQIKTYRHPATETAEEPYCHCFWGAKATVATKFIT